MKVPRSMNMGRMFVALLIIAGTVWIFSAWKVHYESLFPSLVEARPYNYVIRHRLSGVLLWRERILRAPVEGTLFYNKPRQVTRIARNDVFARIERQEGSPVFVRTSAPGYFVPGLDGTEENWSYSDLWSGAQNFPDTGRIKWTENGSYTESGSVIGKMIPFPQELRFIGYMDNRADIVKDLQIGSVKIQQDTHDVPVEAEVRAMKTYGPKIKVYLTLPFFPPRAILARNEDYLVYSGEKAGVILPESCVVVKEGKYGVYMVKGEYAHYTEVKGFPEKDGNFFVEDGLKPGNLVVLDGSSAREGRINLW